MRVPWLSSVDRWIPTETIYKGLATRIQLCRESSMIVKTVLPGQPWLHEVDAMTAVHHPRVANLVAVSTDEHGTHLVIPHYPGGDLFDRVTMCEHLTEAASLKNAADMAEGLAALRRQGWQHLDLKLENFCIDGDGRPVVIDLGSARPVSKDDTVMVPLTEELGTVQYLPPELTDGEYCGRSDVWGLGVCLYIMLVGAMPYAVVQSRPVYQDIPDNLDRLVASAPTVALLRQLTGCVAKRPSIFQAQDLIRDAIMALHCMK
jgi:serine/threonine protein kinase